MLHRPGSKIYPSPRTVRTTAGFFGSASIIGGGCTDHRHVEAIHTACAR